MLFARDVVDTEQLKINKINVIFEFADRFFKQIRIDMINFCILIHFSG